MLKFAKKQTIRYMYHTYKCANKKVLIRLRGYTGWPAPVLFAHTKVRVSLVESYYSDQFKKSIKRYKKVGYNLDIMQHVCMPGLKPKHALKLWLPLFKF